MGRGRKRKRALVHGLFTAILFSHCQLVLRKKKVSARSIRGGVGWGKKGSEKEETAVLLPSSSLLKRMFGRRV